MVTRLSRTWFVMLVLLACLLLSGVVVQAQDTPAPTGVPTYDLPDLDTVVTAPPVPEPDIPLSLFMEGALTLTVVAVIKRFKALENVPAPSLTVLVAFAIWGIFQFARSRGYAAEFQQISDYLVLLIPASVEVILSIFGATAGFLVMRAAQFPLLGYSRS